jgi:hypothetical protein
MRFLSTPLTKETWKIIMIIVMLGFFEYHVLRIGVTPATDTFQSRMVVTFEPVITNKPHLYIDNIFHNKGTDINSHLKNHGLSLPTK